MAMMCLLVLMCLYLSVWQLELFACFLFLGEFTIFIFFYCLFLHLRSGVSRDNSKSINLSWLGIIALILTALAVLFTTHYSYGGSSQASIIMQDLYKLACDFGLNDLSGLFVFFTHSNPSIHLLLGLFLFVLTLFLFAVVSTYTMSGIRSNEFYRANQDRLYLPRGYYEQTAETSQKSFTGSKQ